MTDSDDQILEVIYRRKISNRASGDEVLRELPRSQPTYVDHHVCKPEKLQNQDEIMHATLNESITEIAADSQDLGEKQTLAQKIHSTVRKIGDDLFTHSKKEQDPEIQDIIKETKLRLKRNHQLAQSQYENIIPDVDELKRRATTSSDQ